MFTELNVLKGFFSPCTHTHTHTHTHTQTSGNNASNQVSTASLEIFSFPY